MSGGLSEGRVGKDMSFEEISGVLLGDGGGWVWVRGGEKARVEMREYLLYEVRQQPLDVKMVIIWKNQQVINKISCFF